MAWINNTSGKIPEDPFKMYDEMLEVKGFISEDRARKMLHKLMQEDVTLTAYLLMGIKLGPHQHLAIKTMLKNDYVLNIWGRGSSKTFTSAITAAMIALFNPGIEIGVLGPSFRQAKLILKKLEEIAEKDSAALFKDCIGRISHKNDEWIIPVGKSKIYAVPMGTGEKLRGYRFQCLIVDELLLMPQKILNEVILPFLSVPKDPTERHDVKVAEDELIEMGVMTEAERMEWPNNKFIGLSSASYKFEYLYELYQVYERLILGSTSDAETETQRRLVEEMQKAGATRAVMHLSYEAIPEHFYDQSLLAQARESMSEKQFAREFKSEFIDDSGGFFNMKAMKNCTVPDGEYPSLKIVGQKDKKYIVAIDPSWGDNSGSDDFAMQVVELDDDRKIGTVVHGYARHGGKLGEHISYFHYLISHFNVVAIWVDHGGGPQFINSCNESKFFKDRKVNLSVVDEDFDDTENYDKCIRNAKRLYNKEEGKIVFVRQFGKQNWIRRANELLQASYSHKRIWFGGRCVDSTYHDQLNQEVPIETLCFTQPEEDKEYVETDAMAKKVDLIEKQYDLINLTKAECALIEVKSNPQGAQTFDLPQNLKRQSGANKTRRDSYSALLIANWGVEKWFDMHSDRVKSVTNTFTPFFM